MLIVALKIIGTKIVACIDSRTLTHSTIRHSECEMLVDSEKTSERCQICTAYRKTLHTLSTRLSKLSDARLEVSSHTNYSSLTSSEKNQRMKNLHDVVRQKENKIKYWQEKLDESLRSSSVQLDDALCDDFQTIMASENNLIMKKYPEGSFQNVFWKQQFEAASKSDKRGIRWDPLMIKWCIYLRHKSSGAYEHIRQSGCIALPSQRTLRDYTHYVK